MDEYLIRRQNPAGLSVLDLGCGNGILARYLDQNHFSGNYLGVDASPGLLGLSENKAISPQFAPTFQVLDITDTGLGNSTARFDLSSDRILCRISPYSRGRA